MSDTPSIIPFGSATAVAAFEKFMQQRQITQETMNLMGYALAGADKLGELMGFNPGSDGVIIPYFDLNGDPLVEKRGPYARARLLNPRPGGPKYVQPKRSGVHARLTPNCRWNWAAVAGNPYLPVMLTEGEMKADTANRRDVEWEGRNVATVGLGGVNCGAIREGRSQRLVLVQEIRDWVWKGRQVYICYDHDTICERGAYKIEVRSAAQQLARLLVVHGAVVHFVHLGLTQKAQEGVKLGLDDFILAGGLWDDLLATKEAWGEENALTAMLAQYGLLDGTEAIVNLSSGRLLSKGAFTAQTAHLKVLTGEGKVRPAEDAWWDHPDKIVVSRLEQVPDAKPLSLLPDPRGGTMFNLWPGWGHEPIEDAEVAALWERFVLGLLGEGMAEHWHRWCAWMFQHPAERHSTSWCVLSEKQGIGKSLLCDAVRGAAGRVGRVGDVTSFLSDFNASLFEGVLLLTVDELDSSRVSTSRFKTYRTSDTVRINEKFQLPREVSNCTNFLLTTNDITPYTTTLDARRDLIVRPTPEAHTPAWRAWLSGVAGRFRDARGAAALLHYYLTRDCAGFDRFADAPATEARRRAAEQSEGVNEALAREIRELVGGEGIIPTGGAWLAAICAEEGRGADARKVSKLLRFGGGFVDDAPTGSLLVKYGSRVERCCAFSPRPDYLRGLNKAKELRRCHKLLSERFMCIPFDENAGVGSGEGGAE